MITKAIQKVQSLYSKGVHSMDTRLAPRHIYSVLCDNRATLYAQRSNKSQTIAHEVYQPLAIDLEHVLVSKFGTEKILRSKYKIPTIVYDKDKPLLKGVTSLDGSEIYDVINFGDNDYSSGNKYTSKKIKSYFRDGYLYLVNSKEKKAAVIEAVFNNPLEVYLYDSSFKCDDCECVDIRDYSFHTDNDTLRTVIDMTVASLLGTFLQMKEDKTNNSSDNSAEPAMLHQPQTQASE